MVQPVHHRPTIYDVAEVAGVAPSTVSRAISRPGRINHETAERIWAVARELGYPHTHPPRASAVERPLPIIGLIVTDVTDPRCGEVICGAESAAAEANYTLLVSTWHTVDLDDMLEQTVQTVEGMVLAAERIPEALIDQLASRRPVVIVDRPSASVPTIVVDHLQGARLAAQHLASLGHRSLTYVAGRDLTWRSAARWRGLVGAAKDLRLELHRLGPYPATPAGGAQAITELVRRPTSAVIAFNDEMAMGVIRRLIEVGVRVPEEISVVGFDDVPAAQLVTPPLSTVAAPLRALGVTAVHRLLSVIKGNRPRAAESTTLPVQLVVRGSTAQHCVGARSRSEPAGPTDRRRPSAPLSQRPATPQAEQYSSA